MGGGGSLVCLSCIGQQGRIQDFKLGGAHLKKSRRAEGDAKIFGVFRVKNHDFTPKNYIFPILGGARNFWGISCEKLRFYAKKIIFFFNFRGGAPPESAPGQVQWGVIALINSHWTGIVGSHYTAQFVLDRQWSVIRLFSSFWTGIVGSLECLVSFEQVIFWGVIALITSLWTGIVGSLYCLVCF